MKIKTYQQKSPLKQECEDSYFCNEEKRFMVYVTEAAHEKRESSFTINAKTTKTPTTSLG